LVLGENELARDVVSLKPLRGQGEQEEMTLQQLESFFSSQERIA
jgi:histidyl-tRNA synthetase